MCFRVLVPVATLLALSAPGSDASGSGGSESIEAIGVVQMAPVIASLKEGGDLNALTEEGITLLETATNWNSRDSVKALLERGADPNRRAPSGGCALLISAGRDTEILRTLVRAGANVNHQEDTMGRARSASQLRPVATHLNG